MAEGALSERGTEEEGRGGGGMGTQPLAAALSVTFSMVTSALIILLNRRIIRGLQFPFPWLLTGWGLGVSGLLSFLLCRVGLVPSRARGRVLTAHFFFVETLPVALCTAVGMCLGNAASITVQMSFLQILKAFTPAVTFTVCWLFGLEAASPRVILAVAIIVGGTLVSTREEAAKAVFDARGTVTFLVSILFESTRVVLIQKLLSGRKQNLHPLEGLQYTALPTSVIMLVVSALLERGPFQTSGAWSIVTENPVTFGVAGVLGFLVNLGTFLALAHASSLTLKAATCVRNAALVWIGSLLGESIVPVQVLGYAISVGGFLLYSAVRAPAQAKGKQKSN